MTIKGNGQFYLVKLSRQNQDLLKKLHREQALAGKGKQFLAALRLIYERLRKDPNNLGEPLYRLPGLKLKVFQGIIHPIVVDFAIHEEKPLVFIRGFKVLS